MKTVTKPQIDIISVTPRNTRIGKVYQVVYWDENFTGENDNTIEIMEESLLEVLPPSEFYTTTIEQDKEYLTENLNEVVKDYIQANS